MNIKQLLVIEKGKEMTQEQLDIIKLAIGGGLCGFVFLGIMAMAIFGSRESKKK
jgi:hypothetical protein